MEESKSRYGIVGLGDDKYYFESISPEGKVLIQFKNPVSVRNGIQCEVTIDLHFGEELADTFESRLDVLSLSQREAFSRTLKRTLSPDIQWEKILSNACTGIKRYLEDEDRSIDITTVTDQEDDGWLIPNIIAANGPNILFGKGGTSKTYLTLKMAMALATGGDFLGHKPVRTFKTLFIDYEATRATIAKRIRSLGDKVPENMIWYFSPKGMPLHDCVPSIKKLVAKHGIEFLIIDSAALACGGRPEEAETAIRFFNGLASIGTTSLTIAHETKQEGGNYPFGSVFFWNSPRSIWNIKAENEQESKALKVGLFQKKNNNGHLSSPIGVRVWFGDNQVEIKRGALADDWKTEFPIKKRIKAILWGGPKPLQELQNEMPDVGNPSLRKNLSELKARGELEDMGGVWMILDKVGKGVENPTEI